MQRIKVRMSEQHQQVMIPASKTKARWSDGVLAGLDTETTGVNPQEDRMVTAAIVISDPRHAENVVYEWLIDPGVPIPLDATAIHGVSTEHAQTHGISPVKAIQEILDVLSTLEDVPLIMVNAPFDLTLLDSEIRRHDIGDGLSMPHRIVDTLILDRTLDPWRRGRRTLTAVAASYGLAIHGAHQAAGDVDCSLRLARAMARKFPQLANADLDALQDIQRDACEKWAADYIAYNQKNDNPDFWCDGSWPFIGANDRVRA
jgi:DNA polymerase III subunit epsilon